MEGSDTAYYGGVDEEYYSPGDNPPKVQSRSTSSSESSSRKSSAADVYNNRQQREVAHGRSETHKPAPAWSAGIARPPESWRFDYFGPQRLGHPEVTFTGPDGLGPQRMAVDDEHRYVGNGEASFELTSEADYLWRTLPSTPFPKPKSAFPGAIGWGVQQLRDYAYVRDRAPIMLEFARQEVENRHTHLNQNPWYEAPCPPEFWKGANHLRPQSAPLASVNNNSNNNVYLQHERHNRRTYHSDIRY